MGFIDPNAGLMDDMDSESNKPKQSEATKKIMDILGTIEHSGWSLGAGGMEGLFSKWKSVYDKVPDPDIILDKPDPEPAKYGRFFENLHPEEDIARIDSIWGDRGPPTPEPPAPQTPSPAPVQKKATRDDPVKPEEIQTAPPEPPVTRKIRME